MVEMPARARLTEHFKPQPWEQLIKVLRDTGHGDAARQVAIEKQKQLRRAGKLKGFAGLLHDAYGLVYGYGYQPWRFVVSALIVTAVCASIYHGASEAMAPTDRAVLFNDRYKFCLPEVNPGVTWTTCAVLSKDQYTVFNPWLYSLELVQPIVSFQQVKDWTPIYGSFAWTIARLENLFGWLAGSIFVAVVSGIIKKD